MTQITLTLGLQINRILHSLIYIDYLLLLFITALMFSPVIQGKDTYP